LRGCPVILNVHDPVPELARSKLGLSEHHPIIRGLLFLERISIAFSSHVITATPEFRNILIQRGVDPEKITVISNAANPLFFQAMDRSKAPRTDNGRFILLYVGTVAVRYGLDVCIRALPYLKEYIPRILLRIVPKIKKEGRALEDCLDLAAKLGVRDLVETTDPIPLEEMPRIMTEADLGMYPAYSDCHMDIALSLKIPEMAAVGLPIIATRLPVLVELFGDDAIAFIPPNDPQALARKVLELHDAPECAEGLAEHAAKKSAALSWTEQRLVYRDVLESLLGHSITSRSISTAMPELSD
jgi:glycosyltransferase involved in cell wall biosynthesis